MPPAAATVAGRASSAPRVPRRTSGPATRTRPATQPRPPARPAVRTTARAAAAAAALENALAPAPSRPRREAPRRETPRPRRPSHETRPLRVRGRRRSSFALGLAAAMLPNHRWLDRIVRGRVWIPLLGALLVAIVGLRVEVLKLGSSVGRDIQLVNTLQSGNQILRSQVSELSGNPRIEQLAGEMGMVMPGPMDIHFVQASTASRVATAIRNIHPPSSAAFLSSLAAERAADSTNTIRAADISAVGVQSTNDPGTVMNTPTGATASTGVSTIVPTGGTGATTSTATTGTSTGGMTAGQTSVTTDPTAATGSTATTDSTGPASSGTTGTGTGSTQDTSSSSSTVSSTGGASLAG